MGWDMDGCPFGGCRTSLSPGSLRQGKGLFERLLDVPTGPFLPRWVTTSLPPSVSSEGLWESQASPRPPRLAATHLPVARPSVGVPGCCISRQLRLGRRIGWLGSWDDRGPPEHAVWGGSEVGPPGVVSNRRARAARSPRGSKLMLSF